MWLQEICPEMDTKNGSVHRVLFTHPVEFIPGVDVYIDCASPQGKLVVRLSYNDAPPRSDFAFLAELLGYVPEMVTLPNFDRIERGTIEGLYFWNGSAEPCSVVCGEMKLDSRAVLTIATDGTGIIQIADEYGVFNKPETVL